MFDIGGLEYDWIGRDMDGHIALFSTAGIGYAPDEFLRDTDLHDEKIDRIISSSETTYARFYPPVTRGRVNTWRIFAERGMYAYDCDVSTGAYRLVAAPQAATHVTDIDSDIVATAVVLCGCSCFERHTVLAEDRLRVRR